MSAWLGRQRKPELLALAAHTSLQDLDGLRKEEVVAELDDHLQKNATKYSGNEVFKEYYGRSSPTKRAVSGASATGADGEIKVKKPRAPKVKKEEIDGGASSPGPTTTPAPVRAAANAIARTPSQALTHTQQRLSTFPPSPAIVTDAIDLQARKFSAQLDRTLVRTNARTTLHDIRTLTSSVVGIESLVFLLEGYHLQAALIPWRRAFDLPPIGFLGTDSHPVHVPDFFVTLTDIYWKATTFWFLVSFFLPLLVSWFFNLTMRPVVKGGVSSLKPRWRCDPLTFNVAKALFGWLVFAKGVRFAGLYSDITVQSVLQALPGGFSGVQVGAFVGILASLYDAAQRK